MSLRKPYSIPKFVISKGDWFVEYYFDIPGTTERKRFKERMGIGLEKKKYGVKHAVEYGKAACEFLHEKLKAGFNPFTVQKVEVPAGAKIGEILTKIKDNLSNGASKTQKASYTEFYNRITKYISDNRLAECYMSELTYKHAEGFKSDMLNKYRLSAKTINGALSYGGMFWRAALPMGAAQVDIFASVATVKNDKSDNDKERFQPFTANEIGLIINYLRANDQCNFIRFCLFIYYAWARPIEICRLRVGDIDLEEDLIKFRKGKTKNNKSAMVQIVPPLKKVLSEMNLAEFPADYYLFSMDGNYMPGKVPNGKNRPSDRWNRWIKEKLKINKEMYGLKHTGNIDYLLKNKGKVNMKWQQMQNRHHSITMTETYIKRLGAYFIEVEEVNFNEFS